MKPGEVMNSALLRGCSRSQETFQTFVPSEIHRACKPIGGSRTPITKAHRHGLAGGFLAEELTHNDHGNNGTQKAASGGGRRAAK